MKLKLFVVLAAVALLAGCAPELKRDVLSAQAQLLKAQAVNRSKPLVDLEFFPDGRPKRITMGQPDSGQNPATQLQAPKSELAEALHEFGGVLNAPLFNILGAGWAAKSLAGAVQSPQSTINTDNHASSMTSSSDSHAVAVDSHAVATDNHSAAAPVAAKP